MNSSAATSIMEGLSIFALTIAWAAVGCGDSGGADSSASVTPPTSRPVEVEVVTLRSHASWAKVSGIVEADVDIALAFRVGGFLATLAVDEGERVEAGLVLARLDTRDYERDVRMAQAALDSAEARTADAKREFDRQDRLLTSNSTSSRNLESARSAHQIASAELRQARVGLEAAKVALDDCVLRAPVRSHVHERLVEEHEFASAHMPVIVLSRIEPVKVRASVADRYMRSLSLGGKVELRTGAWPGRVFDGRITRLSVAADAVTHMIPFEVEIPNGDLALRPDMVVEVAVATGVSTGLITLPLNAVVRDGALRTLCFIVSQTVDGLAAEMRPLILGGLRGDRVEVKRGLVPGESVIVRGQHFLKEGDPIHRVEGVEEGVEMARAEEPDE